MLPFRKVNPCTSDPDPAAARFQVGSVRLDLYPPPGVPFDSARLPVSPEEGAANLGNAVGLVAVDLDVTAVRPGETSPVTLYWRALSAIDVSYTVFVQAIDEEGGKAGQADRLPCNGGCPTIIRDKQAALGRGHHFKRAVTQAAQPITYTPCVAIRLMVSVAKVARDIEIIAPIVVKIGR